MFWDDKYKGSSRIWGDKPGELAVAAVKCLQTLGLNEKNLSILDIGCGYGRDIIYFSKHLKCTVLGIDISKEAVDIARNSYRESNIKFRHCDFAELNENRYDVIFTANLYHLLRPAKREQLIKKIKKNLRPGGLLFLNALSTKDPEEYGKGIPVQDEPIHSKKKNTCISPLKKNWKKTLIS